MGASNKNRDNSVIYAVCRNDGRGEEVTHCMHDVQRWRKKFIRLSGGGPGARIRRLSRSNKWWHTVFFWILDVAAINSEITWYKRNNLMATHYKHTSKLSKRKEFLMELVKRRGCVGRYT